MMLWDNVSLVGKGVTGCYTTVVKTVQIHVVYGYIVLRGSHILPYGLQKINIMEV